MNSSLTKIITIITLLFVIFLAGCKKKSDILVIEEIPGIPDLTKLKTDKTFPQYEVKIQGDSQFSAGSTAAFRITTLTPAGQNPVPEVPVSFLFTKQGEGKDDPERIDEFRNKLLFSQKTENDRSLDAKFSIPEDFEGEYLMEVVTGVPENHITSRTFIKVEKAQAITGE